MIRTFLLALLVFACVPQARADDACTDGEVTEQARQDARQAYFAVRSGDADLPAIREKLAAHRAAETTCDGISMLDQAIVYVDVHGEDLQAAVDAMPAFLDPGLYPENKVAPVSLLVGRLLMAGETDTALRIDTMARDALGDDGPFAFGTIIVLTAAGRFDEARALADAAMEKHPDQSAPLRIPAGGVVRLAVAAASGDADDIDAVLDILSAHMGEDAALLLSEYAPYSLMEFYVARMAGEIQVLQPIKRPVPVFPSRMLERGIEGNCEVYFNVNPNGKPIDVVAFCTHDGFVEEAARAVSNTVFAPLVIDGKPRSQYNAVYPIGFYLH